MTGNLTMVSLAKIHPSEDNPRTEFDDDRMAELVASVKRHGIITPLTLAPDGDDGYTIIAGERRYRAAKAAKLTEVAAQVRDANSDTLTLAIAENVIRADLTPIEEARAYRRLADDGDTAKVARLVGRSEGLIAERLDLLRLPDRTQQLISKRRLPLGCAPALLRIAEREPLLADLTAAWLAERPHNAGTFPRTPGEIVDDVLGVDWRDDADTPMIPVAYRASEYSHGPILPDGARDADAIAAVLAKLGDHGDRVASAFAALPEIAHTSEHDWEAREAEHHRWGGCFALTTEDTDAARAFGCLLELPGRNERSHTYVTDPEWLADRLAQRIAAHAASEAQRRQQPPAGQSTGLDDGEKEARRRERQRQYEERTTARARNLDLGAALARWEPKLDTDTVKLLGSLVLIEHGRSAAWAYRLCVEQPSTINKQARTTVHYPRGAEAQDKAHADAVDTLRRAKTPEAALAVVLRLLVAQRLADTAGLPMADRQGIYEPSELADSAALGKLATRVAPASVKKHEAERNAQSTREQATRRPAPEDATEAAA